MKYILNTRLDALIIDNIDYVHVYVVYIIYALIYLQFQLNGIRYFDIILQIYLVIFLCKVYCPKMIKVTNAQYKNIQSHAHDAPRTVAVEGAWHIPL